MTGTPYDDFGAGSLIFNGKLKPGTYKVIQSDEDKINEIGDMSSKSYSFKNITATKYSFFTDSGLEYIVEFEIDEPYARVDFYIKNSKSDNIWKEKINRGEIFRVMSTITNIVNKFLNESPKIDVLVIEPSKQDIDDNRRYNLYMAFIQKNISPVEYKIKATPKEINIIRKKQAGKNTDLNENANYSSDIDYKKQILELTKYFLKQHPHIKSLPKIIFKHNNTQNAKNFFGKTAYYNPETKTIVIYTEGRHPKDLTKSFAHELIHFLQDIEGRLYNIQTTNTNEDNDLNILEKEAYLKGNIIFRNWSDIKSSL
jgi:hypothetical protein